MATWIDPVDSQTDPDAPITSDLAKRWDNNVVAAFEGAVGAERLDADATGGSVAGDELLFSSGVDVEYEAINFPAECSFRATSSCQVRVRGQMSSTNSNSSVRVFKNNTVIRSFSNNTGNFVSWGTNDIDLVAGDIVRVGSAEAGGFPVTVRNVTYSTGPKRSVGGI